MVQLTGSKLEKEYGSAVYCHLAYLTYMQSTPCAIPPPWNQDCQEKYQEPQIFEWYHSHDRKWRESKEPLDKCERGEWKSWLHSTFKKLRSQHLILSLHGKGWKSGSSYRFSWAPKLSIDSDSSLEVKRCLLLGRKAMRNLSESESCSVMSQSLWPRGLCMSMAFSSPEYWSQ